jgi:hypothetical protein
MLDGAVVNLRKPTAVGRLLSLDCCTNGRGQRYYIRVGHWHAYLFIDPLPFRTTSNRRGSGIIAVFHHWF